MEVPVIAFAAFIVVFDGGTAEGTRHNTISTIAPSS